MMVFPCRSAELHMRKWIKQQTTQGWRHMVNSKTGSLMSAAIRRSHAVPTISHFGWPSTVKGHKTGTLPGTLPSTQG